VHPGQRMYYRGDKHSHFVTSQLICSLQGIMLNVCFGLGHNNDQGMFNISGMREYMEENLIRGTGDRGYSHYLITTPNTIENENDLKRLAIQRSVVEVVFSFIKNFGFANSKVMHDPELQVVALMVIYQLVNIRLKQYPLNWTSYIYQ